jgi:2'-5' RNA ligase
VSAQSETWRLFVAIALPKSVKLELARAQRELQESLPQGCIRWTKPESFHLTLKFLGMVAVDRVDELVQSLRAGCANFPTMQLRAEGIGFFPNARRPRVVWAGVKDQAEMLPKLQRAIEKSVATFTDEKMEARFIGHVTLGRCPMIKPAQAELLLNVAARGIGKRIFGEWTASEFELIRSELTPTASHYTTLSVIPLAADSSLSFA